MMKYGMMQETWSKVSFCLLCNTPQWFVFPRHSTGPANFLTKFEITEDLNREMLCQRTRNLRLIRQSSCLLKTTLDNSDLIVFLGLLDLACSSGEVNIFIRHCLQPDEKFHHLYNDAIHSLYKELQRLLGDTFYGIHNLIEVSGATTFSPPTHSKERRRGNRIVTSRCR